MIVQKEKFLKFRIMAIDFLILMVYTRQYLDFKFLLVVIIISNNLFYL